MVTGLAVLLTYSYFGLNVLTVFSSIACVVAFCTIAMFIPLESTSDNNETS